MRSDDVIKMKRANLIGRIFSNLTVIDDAPDYVHNGRTHRMVMCKCKCGCVKKIRAESLCSGRTTSCGCSQKKSVIKRNTKHGMSDDELYTTWKGMRERCSNPKQKHHKYYADKGIYVCKEWNDFITFRLWAISNGWRKGLQVDRINGDKGYTPKNCRLVTPKENSKNKSNVKLITINGCTRCQAEWCRILNISPAKVILISKKLNVSRTDAIKEIFKT